MLPSDWRAEPAQSTPPPPSPESEDPLGDGGIETPPDASLGERLASLGTIEAPRENPDGGHDFAPRPAVPDETPDGPRPLGSSGGAGLESPAVAAWIKRARRRRFRTALQRTGSWLITISTIALIAGAAAFALLGLG